MKKLSNINESIWSDLQDRSSGEVTRKEDDVNHLDLDGLCEYIKNKYGPSIEDVDTKIFPGVQQEVWTDITHTISLGTRHKKDGTFDFVLLSWFSSKIAGRFFFRLKERFNVESPNPFRRIITEIDGTCTNKTYLDVLDLFMEDKDGNILKESVWSDLQDRSSGEVTRKEDIINSNVKDMIPVDLGLSVLWADRDLEIDGENEFTIDEIVDYKPIGWRRPTREEANELFKNVKKEINQDIRLKFFKSVITLSNDKGSLIFSRKNLAEKFNYFELDNEDDTHWMIFTMEKSGSFVAHSIYWSASKDEKCRVRFVKNK